ncbi:MAG TPA: hypothetical protein VNA29_00885 [Sphingomicrobium sp.]|nr:hypothetical protein [Sphingomicrobium sp.]
MSARGFGSIVWAGAVAGAALGFYLVSLNVASERAQLEDVEGRIALAQRDIRVLQTEIGTRGRLAQLERWNVKFIRLSAPSADQFIEGGFQLATLTTPQKKPAIDAPVVLAAAPVGGGALPADGVSPALREAGEIMHVASYSVPQRSEQAKAELPRLQVAKPAPQKTNIATTAKPAPATKPSKSATADPLAPLSGATAKAKAGPPASTAGGAKSSNQSRDSDS